jgi:hypothetical protein
MFELMVGIDGVHRRVGERVEKTRRADDGERRSRLRAAFAARRARETPVRCGRLPLTQSR